MSSTNPTRLDETCGPCEAECPADILHLLTTTTNEHALEWRARCRATISRRTTKPRLRNGWTLVFANPIRFSDGSEHCRLKVDIDPRRPRAVRFRPERGYGFYRIGRLDSLDYTIEPNA